jgi:quinol monooxygenase YgiN
MQIVVVQVQVKPECVEAFKQAAMANSAGSLREPGVARFDVCQQGDDPTKFVLYEVYRTAEAVAAHKETAHYLAWRDTVAPMMAAPRVGIRYHNIAPSDAAW